MKNFYFMLKVLLHISYSQNRIQMQPPELFCKKRCSQKFHKIHRKVAGLRPATLFKKSLWHRCFPVNFAKFLRTPFLQNTSGRLLLRISFLRYLHLCLDFYIKHVKRLDRETMFNFKTYYVTDWTAIHYNTHIAQYLNK